MPHPPWRPHPAPIRTAFHRRRVLRSLLHGATLAVIGTIAWFILKTAGPAPAWVSATAPSLAEFDEPFVLQLKIRRPLSPGQLCADLHGFTTRGDRRQFLARLGSLPIQPHLTDYTFSAVVPRHTNLGFVNAAIFVSPTGHWTNHTLAAYSDRIPVAEETVEPPRRRLGALRLHTADTHPPLPPEPSVPARFLIACLFSLAAVFGARSLRPWRSGSSPAHLLDRRIRTLAVAGPVGSAFWEFLNAGPRLHDFLQASALSHQLYAGRAPLQQVLTVLLLVAAVHLAWTAGFSRQPGPLRLLFVAWLAHVVLSFLAVCSLHALDNLGGPTGWGASRLQWAKIASAIISAWAALRLLRWACPPLSPRAATSAPPTPH